MRAYYGPPSICLNSSNPHNNPMKKETQYPHFADETKEAQRCEVACPKTHSQEETELGSNVGLCGREAEALEFLPRKLS